MALQTPLYLIAALGRNRVIGVSGDLPWRLPDDLKRFKALTLGQTLLMGRKTWTSLGRPLPGRDNRVLSRAPRFAAEGARVFDRLDAALACPQGEAVWVIGGGELYAALLPRATRLYLTEVDAAPEGDTWFPALDPAQWQEVARTHHAADERHAAAFDFVDYVRRLPGEQ
jgi:dihydrofolate reductase|tara:strand:- start:283 stop:792 length:510 start_codon:yes stop_codon:yes gene_type:complete